MTQKNPAPGYHRFAGFFYVLFTRRPAAVQHIEYDIIILFLFRACLL